jgi:hypothetical protein
MMYTPATPIEVLRIIDAIFSNAGIYPPRLQEIEKGKYAGDVDDGEYLYFKWNDGLVGVSYDNHVFDNLDALEKSVVEIHNEFKNKANNVSAQEDMPIIPDRIIIISDY